MDIRRQSFEFLRGREFRLFELVAIAEAIRMAPRLVERARGDGVLHFARINISLREAIILIGDRHAQQDEEALTIPALRCTHFFDLVGPRDFRGAIFYELTHYVIDQNPKILGAVKRIFNQLKINSVRNRLINEISALENPNVPELSPDKIEEKKQHVIEKKLLLSELARRASDELFVSHYAAENPEELICEIVRYFMEGSLGVSQYPLQHAFAQQFFKGL